MLLLAEMPAVIAPQDNERVVCAGPAIEGLEQLADLGIDEGDAGQVRPYGSLPLFVLDDRRMRARRFRFQRPLASDGA